MHRPPDFDDEGLMAEAATPTVARRRVRVALREARESAGLTQQQVADEMEWSLSKVIRIENGEVTIAPNDLRPLLGYLGVRDKAVVSALLIDARIARTRQRQVWWQSPAFREVLSESLRKLIEYESEASRIRYWSIYFIPGTLQIPSYADALMKLYGDDFPDELARLKLDARQRRRQALLNRGGLVELFVLLDESVLMRPIGGAEVFTEQLREMHRLASAGRINLRMVPYVLNAPVTNNATFDLLSLGENDSEGMLLYHENGLTDEAIETKSTTERHRARFDRVWHEALSEADTIDFVRKRIDELEAQGPRATYLP